MDKRALPSPLRNEPAASVGTALVWKATMVPRITHRQPAASLDLAQETTMTVGSATADSINDIKAKDLELDSVERQTA